MTRSQLEPSAQAPCSSTITGFGPPPQWKACEPLARAEAPWLVRASRPATARTAAKMIRSSRVRCAAQGIFIDVPSFARGHVDCRPGCRNPYGLPSEALYAAGFARTGSWFAAPDGDRGTAVRNAQPRRAEAHPASSRHLGLREHPRRPADAAPFH